MQKYTLPDFYQEKIESLLNEYNCSLNQPKIIADAVLKLSTHYQSINRVTPWASSEDVIAYAAYFFPLNYVRNLKLWDHARAVGFPSSMNQVLDYGCGLGSSLLSGQDNFFWKQHTALFAVDHMPQPLRLLKKYLLPHIDFKTSLPFDFKNTLGLFSYSWNELKETPSWFFKLDHILIVEPSTSLRSRQLMDFRSLLMDQGYFIWAPCTHSLTCPLLSQSKTDWCHDRIHWEQPEWFQNIERHLPIKNNTLTVSYLLASKEKPTATYFGRIIGDELIEKGKTRWLFCRNENREFLSHLSRNGASPDYKRGQLLKNPIGYEQKARELRITQS